MENNNFFKYIFAIVVVFLICYTAFIIIQNKTDSTDVLLDQTSTLTNIQTDLRLSIVELDTLNPILSNNRNVQEISKVIFEPLVTLNENYKLEYCLAEEIAKIDEINYVIKLRKGVLWENNANFTADDVKFTIDIIKDLEKRGIHSIYTENLKNVVGLETIDSSTLKITLSHEIPFFEYNLTFPIMCASYYQGEDFASSLKAPIGTGMFKISETSANMIKLIKNDNYWNTAKDSTVTEVYVNLYNSMGEAYNAFKSGDIDIIIVKNTNVEEYIGTLGYNKIEFKSRDYDFISLNTNNYILSDVNIRKALGDIIDKNKLVANCLGSGYVASNFSLDMGNWLYTKDLNISTDTEQARQILLVNGWTQVNNKWQKKIDGRTIKLEITLTVNNNNSTRIAIAEELKKQFEDFGIVIHIRQLSAESYATALNNRDYEMILCGIQTAFSPNLNTFFGEGNLSNYNNNEILEIMNTIKNTTDENVLYERYSRLYDIYLEEVPYIGLYRNTISVIYNQGLVGNIKPNLFNIYHNIEKWYRQ